MIYRSQSPLTHACVADNCDFLQQPRDTCMAVRIVVLILYAWQPTISDWSTTESQRNARLLCLTFETMYWTTTCASDCQTGEGIFLERFLVSCVDRGGGLILCIVRSHYSILTGDARLASLVGDGSCPEVIIKLTASSLLLCFFSA